MNQDAKMEDWNIIFVKFVTMSADQFESFVGQKSQNQTPILCGSINLRSCIQNFQKNQKNATSVLLMCDSDLWYCVIDSYKMNN